MLSANIIKKLAKKAGADLVGIAAVSCFEGVESNENPAAIKPDTKSVIVLGFRYLRGSLRGIENGTNWGTLSGADPVGMSAFMQEATYHFCRMLENEGYEALPLIRHSYDLRNQGVPVSPDQPAPDVIIDMEYAAYAAGLGEMGDGKLFLTPEFGPRQVFSAVLTELELVPDPVFEGQICDHCGECVAACPSMALNKNKVVEQQYPAGSLQHYSLRVESCQICKTGTSSRPYSLGLEPNRVGAACGRACNRHLESIGRLTGLRIEYAEQ
jgi:epoxyqueuosine reductase QueG